MPISSSKSLWCFSRLESTNINIQCKFLVSTISFHRITTKKFKSIKKATIISVEFSVFPVSRLPNPGPCLYLSALSTYPYLIYAFFLHAIVSKITNGTRILYIIFKILFNLKCIGFFYVIRFDLNIQNHRQVL